MRYRFKGFVRESGKPVEGHVQAAQEGEAYDILAENGIVTESIRPDPRPSDMYPQGIQPRQAAAPAAAGAAPLADAIDSALDTSSSQVPFDSLAQHYKGKNVWVIDREKIRRYVAQVVDQALQTSMAQSTATEETRKTVADAIEKLFKDNRNITSPASQVQQQNRGGGGNHPDLEYQIQRLSGVIRQAENMIASMSMLARRMGRGGGGGGGGRGRYVPGQVDDAHNEVLLEIFKSNLELIRTIEDQNNPPVAAPTEGSAAAQSGTDAAGSTNGNGSSGNGDGDTPRERPQTP
jgi:hypothetical protein